MSLNPWETENYADQYGAGSRPASVATQGGQSNNGHNGGPANAPVNAPAGQQGGHPYSWGSLGSDAAPPYSRPPTYVEDPSSQPQSPDTSQTNLLRPQPPRPLPPVPNQNTRHRSNAGTPSGTKAVGNPQQAAIPKATPPKPATANIRPSGRGKGAPSAVKTGKNTPGTPNKVSGLPGGKPQPKMKTPNKK